MTNAPIIFLDIDGVLNGFRLFDGERSPQPIIHHECVPHLNRIVQATGAQLVISSTWRYAIHTGEMTIGGFETMLRSHRIRARVIGATPPDGPDLTERYEQIERWIADNKFTGRYVILDDDGDMGALAPRLVQTSCYYGLRPEDADRAVAILTESCNAA